MKSYDVIIIGGGVVGTSIGRELSRYRCTTALLEKEHECAFGVSKSNSGIIHPGTQNPPHSLKGRLCVRGNRLMREIARDLGVDFKEVGELIVAFSSEDALVLKQLKKEALRLGVPRLTIVDRRWLQRHEPNLNPQACAALYAPTAGIISPYRLTYDLAENALRNGLEVHTGTRVERIVVKRACDFEVKTSNGDFSCRYIVNAAGLYADTVAEMVGIHDFQITPRKGEEFLLDKKRQYITRHLLFPIPSSHSKGILVIKTADGNPMIGPTAEDISDKEDRSTTREGLHKVLNGVRKLIPSIDPNDIIAYFAGLRPVAGDDFILRAEEEPRGMVTVAGIQSPGLTAAPAIALESVRLLHAAGLDLRKKLYFHKWRRKSIHLFDVSLSRAARLIKGNPAYGDIVCRCEMVSAKEIRDAITRGARTLDGVKFRTRAQAGRCHGSFCTAKILKMLAEESMLPVTAVSKRGKGSELIMKDKREYDQA